MHSPLQHVPCSKSQVHTVPTSHRHTKPSLKHTNLDLQDLVLLLLQLQGLLAVLRQQLGVGVDLVLQVVVQLLHLLVQDVELLLHPVRGHLALPQHLLQPFHLQAPQKEIVSHLQKKETVVLTHLRQPTGLQGCALWPKSPKADTECPLRSKSPNTDTECALWPKISKAEAGCGVVHSWGKLKAMRRSHLLLALLGGG